MIARKSLRGNGVMYRWRISVLGPTSRGKNRVLNVGPDIAEEIRGTQPGGKLFRAEGIVEPVAEVASVRVLITCVMAISQQSSDQARRLALSSVRWRSIDEPGCEAAIDLRS
jgi:hypothetical protein